MAIGSGIYTEFEQYKNKKIFLYVIQQITVWRREISCPYLCTACNLVKIKFEFLYKRKTIHSFHI